jgi:hypothetical protein
MATAMVHEKFTAGEQELNTLTDSQTRGKTFAMGTHNLTKLNANFEATFI